MYLISIFSLIFILKYEYFLTYFNYFLLWFKGQEQKGSGGLNLGPLAAAGAAALAGAAGSALIGGKKHKKHKHGHGIPGLPGAGPASLITGVGSLLTGDKHGVSLLLFVQ